MNAYVQAAGGTVDVEPTHRSLARARLLNAARWIGWAPRWIPPAEHAHGWVGDVVDAGRALG